MADTPGTVENVREQVDAQVAPPREPDADKVDVRETYVTTDVPVLDPSAPEAVIVPDEGRGSLELPAERLDGQTPEQVFGTPDEDAEPEQVEVGDQTSADQPQQ